MRGHGYRNCKCGIVQLSFSRLQRFAVSLLHIEDVGGTVQYVQVRQEQVSCYKIVGYVAESSYVNARERLVVARSSQLTQAQEAGTLKTIIFCL
jgi:hypothetical protein